RLEGELDVKALRRSMGEIVRRHEVLRTRFVSVNGEARQKIERAGEWALPVVDLSDLERQEVEAGELVRAEAGQPFDLRRGPLLRTMLLRLGDHEHVLLATVHHIVSDGWSRGILFGELTALYEAYRNNRNSPLAELDIQYGDYAVWQRNWLQGEV